MKAWKVMGKGIGSQLQRSVAALALACASDPPAAPAHVELDELSAAAAEVEGLRSHPSDLRIVSELRGEGGGVAVALSSPLLAAGPGWREKETLTCFRRPASAAWRCASPTVQTLADVPGGPGSVVVDLPGEEAARIIRFLSEAASADHPPLSPAEVRTIDCVVGLEGNGNAWIRFAPILNHAGASFGIAQVEWSGGDPRLVTIERANWAEDPAAGLHTRCDAGLGTPLEAD